MSWSSREIFQRLDGYVFASFRDLESELLQRFNENIDQIPPGYSYRQLIGLAEERGWLIHTGQEFKIQMGVRSPSAILE